MTELHGSASRFDPTATVVGVLGGTGDLGRGLAQRWAEAGLHVVLGSRTAARAAETAAAIGGNVTGADNADCARRADIAVIAVPWEAHAALLEDCREGLAGTIVVDVVNPLGFDGQGAFALDVEGGSACQQAQRALPESRVVGAFHHISAVLLLDPEVTELDLDVLVVGDDRAATEDVCALAACLPGVTGVYAGRLRNAHQVEALTANLISVNRRYKTHAGLRVTRP